MPAWPFGAAEPVTVFAAASLAGVLEVLAARWAAAGGPALRVSLAASSTLARQIEQGAAADVFLSADEAWMDYLARRGRIEAGSRRVLATNRLVVVRSGATPMPAEPPEDSAALRAALLGAGRGARIATGDPAHVPVGRYAEQALRKLGLWSEIEARLVRADNVRSALAFVERGEAQAGIVYATDARVARDVSAARFPAAAHESIRYPAALVSPASPAARAAPARMFAPEAQQALRAAGFGPPEP